jgi:hypothetical protein
MSDAIAINALEKVRTLAEQLGQAEGILERGYAQFAEALLAVQKGRFWEGQFESWGKYMQFITETYNLGLKQLYHKVAVVRELTGVVEPADMTAIGISKASVLADIHRANGSLPENALATAKDETKTAKDLKQILAETLHLPVPDDGTWFDMEFAFVCSEEERLVLIEAENIVRAIDPPISTTLKTFEQKKQVALRMAMEILNTYTLPPVEDDPTVQDDAIPADLEAEPDIDEKAGF